MFGNKPLEKQKNGLIKPFFCCKYELTQLLLADLLEQPDGQRTPTATQTSVPKDIIKYQKLPQPVPQPPIALIIP